MFTNSEFKMTFGHTIKVGMAPPHLHLYTSLESNILVNKSLNLKRFLTLIGYIK